MEIFKCNCGWFGKKPIMKPLGNANVKCPDCDKVIKTVIIEVTCPLCGKEVMVEM